jgi:predicted ATPase
MTTIYDDYVESIKFITPFRCFIQGDKISFRPGLNVLVGENGTGKSSIVELVRKSVIYSEFAIVKIPSGWAVGGFDFERG